VGENEPIPTSVLDMAMDLLALALGGNANEESKVSLEARRGDENKQRDGSSLVDTDIQTLVGPLPEDQRPELMRRKPARVKGTNKKEGRGDGRGEKVSVEEFRFRPQKKGWMDRE